MPPKQVRVQPRQQSSQPQISSSQPTSYLSSAYHEVTSPENASVVKSVVIFGVAVTFFSSSWSEILLPGL